MFLGINDIKDAAAKMQQATGIGYTNFNFSFFKRRLGLVLDRLLVRKMQDFYDMLADKDKLDGIVSDMEVPGTEMFRDPGFWRSLRKLIENKPSLRIWIPNLTNCYELYSLLILLKEMRLLDKSHITVNATAQAIIDEVKSGAIPSKTDEINTQNFSRLEFQSQYTDYVTANADRTEYKIDLALLRDVNFERTWFLNSPWDKYDVVLFRNVLLNYNQQLHEKAMNYITGTLDSHGLVALGIKELPLIKAPMFAAIDASEAIYGRTN